MNNEILSEMAELPLTDDFTQADVVKTTSLASAVDLTPIYNFLGARTSQAWVDAALADLPTIIQDHANCEKKAAGTAMNIIFRYEFAYNLQCKLAQLIREEMLHYEQVI
jgi:tRNA-(ms[2]io[6]A)-hydroxylase